MQARLSYRRYAQRRHATRPSRRSSCSAAINADRTPTALPRAVPNRLVMPSPPAPSSQRGLASPRPRLRLVCLSRPPEHCATRSARSRLALNCVAAAHRRSRSPLPLAAAPLRRLRRRRQGLPPPLAAPARLNALADYIFSGSICANFYGLAHHCLTSSLYPASNQDADRADRRRASGRCSGPGAGRRKDPDLSLRTDGRLLSRFQVRAAQRRNLHVYNFLTEL
jgi:hypothetical protein